MPQLIPIRDKYITLGQLLKLTGAVATGGQGKHFLQEYEIKVNGVRETRRGKKVYVGDQIDIENVGSFLIVSKG